MENENPEIQKQWKIERLILGIATLIIPLSFLLGLPFGREYGLIPFAFLITDMFYFTFAAEDMGRLKINIGFRVLIILLFFPITKLLAIIIYNRIYYPLHPVFESSNIVHIYFLLPPLLYFLITARNLKLFVKLRRERKNDTLEPLKFVFAFMLVFLWICAITIPTLRM